MRFTGISHLWFGFSASDLSYLSARYYFTILNFDMYNAYLKNSLILNKEDCNGCMMCIMVCPHQVFGKYNKKVTLINQQSCMECGACMRNCAVGAIIVKSGVGCATAMFYASLKGKKMDECSCG